MTLSAPASTLQSDSVDEDDRPTSEPPTVPLKPSIPAADPARPKSGRRRAVSQERLATLVKGRKAVLCVDNVSVSFDGFKALNELTLILDEGELRCIIGPNGAGKTTLMDCITGKTRPDEGNVYLVGYGEDLIGLSEHEIAGLGICRKFQRPTVFGGHSVFENLELALAGNRSVWRSLFGGLSKAEAEVIDETLETIGLKDARERPAGQLSHGQKQWLEIGMLLAQKPRVLLVDEPIAGMTHAETERTAELLVSLAGERTVVVVEHDMEFVRNIASRVTVLHEGRVLAEGSLDQVQANPEVVQVYLGAEHA
ncbi:MAG TPA: urea ABC transporter ATP-binding protein UrtD [Polyangiaceae bacterium]|nr:urea ABC transporter ATP-binding protein UrtD [Polyangiaceae bacterium]